MLSRFITPPFLRRPLCWVVGGLRGRGFWIFELLEANATAMMASIDAIKDLKEKLKLAQQLTEEMFIGSEDDDSDDVK